MKLILVLFALLASANAQSIPPLTLEQCIRLARQNNARAHASASRIRETELAREEISTTGLPDLRYGLGLSHAPSWRRFGYDPAITTEGEVAGQIILQQPLSSAGVRGLRSAQLDADIRRSATEQRVLLRDLAFEVTLAYIEARRAEEEASIQRSSVAQLSEYLRLVKQLSAAGAAGYTDVLKTETQLSSAGLSLRKAEEAGALARMTLAELIGAPIDTSFAVTGALDSLVAPPGENTAPEGVIDRSFDLRIAEYDIASGMLDADIATRERLPVVSLVADAGLLTSIENLKLPPADRAGVLGYSVGISVGGGLFNWGGTDLRVQQKQLHVDFLRLQAETLRRSLDAEFRKSRMRLSNAQGRLSELRSSIARANDTWLLTKSMFAGGGIMSLEVLAAQQSLTEARLELVQTQADIQTLAARLRQIATTEEEQQ